MKTSEALKNAALTLDHVQRRQNEGRPVSADEMSSACLASIQITVCLRAICIALSIDPEINEADYLLKPPTLPVHFAKLIEG